MDWVGIYTDYEIYSTHMSISVELFVYAYMSYIYTECLSLRRIRAFKLLLSRFSFERFQLMARYNKS